MKIKDNRFVSGLICVGIVACIFIGSSILDSSKFGLFTSIISGIGLFFIWVFSPNHHIKDGLKQIPVMYWLKTISGLIGMIVVLILLYLKHPSIPFSKDLSIPFSAVCIFILSGFILIIGVDMLTSKLFKRDQKRKK